MDSCVQFCVLRIREMIKTRITLDLVCEIRDLAEELRVKVCDDAETCECLAENTVVYWAGISVPTLKIWSLHEKVTRTFCNVVCLDTNYIFEGQGDNMPSVKKLTMYFCKDTDAEWLRISNMFNNVEDFTVRRDDMEFTFTKSWLTGSVFPKLTRIKIKATNILFEKVAKWQQRNIVRVRLFVEYGISDEVFRLVNPWSIRNFSANRLVGPADENWWRLVMTLPRLRLQLSMYNALSLLVRREGLELETEIVDCVCPPDSLSPLFVFIRQEAKTLRVVNCFIDVTAGKATRQFCLDTARKIFADNPLLDIVKMTTREYPSRRFVLFVPSAANTERIRRKEKASDILSEYYAADSARNVHKTELSAFQ